MLRKAREIGKGIPIAARCLLVAAGREYPTAEEAVIAGLVAHALNDLHVLALGKNLKE